MADKKQFSSSSNPAWPQSRPDDSIVRSIHYTVPLIPQTSVMGCWAAGIAMILAWRNHTLINPEMIAKNPGSVPYLTELQSGLDPNDTLLLQRWGFVVRRPQSYTVTSFTQLLKEFGPLWVAARLPRIPAHIRVVTGIDFDQNPDLAKIYINDPWEVGMRAFRWPNRGSRYTRTFRQFTTEVEKLAVAEKNQPAPIYIAHLPK